METTKMTDKHPDDHIPADIENQTRRDKLVEYKRLYDNLAEAVALAQIEVAAAVIACDFVQAIASKITTKAMMDESWVSDFEPELPNYDPPEDILKMQDGWVRGDLEAKLEQMLADCRERCNAVTKAANGPNGEAIKEFLEGDCSVTDETTGFFMVDGEMHVLEPTETAL